MHHLVPFMEKLSSYEENIGDKKETQYCNKKSTEKEEKKTRV